MRENIFQVFEEATLKNAKFEPGCGLITKSGVSLRFGAASPMLIHSFSVLSLSTRVQVAARKISGGGWKATAENESFMCMKGRRPLCNPCPCACCRVCFLPHACIYTCDGVSAVCENRICIRMYVLSGPKQQQRSACKRFSLCLLGAVLGPLGVVSLCACVCTLFEILIKDRCVLQLIV